MEEWFNDIKMCVRVVQSDDYNSITRFHHGPALTDTWEVAPYIPLGLRALHVLYSKTGWSWGSW